MNSILTLVTAAGSFDLTTLEAVKADMDVSATDDDAYLSAQITRASLDIASFCDRVFPAQTYSEQFRLSGCRDRLTLSRYPVAEIVSVTVDGTALAAEDYEIDGPTGFLYRLDGSDCRRAWAARKVVVQYEAGYASTPADLAGICIDLVKRRYYARTRDPALRSVDVPDVVEEQYWGGENAKTVGGLPEDIAGALAPYRNFSVG